MATLLNLYSALVECMLVCSGNQKLKCILSTICLCAYDCMTDWNVFKSAGELVKSEPGCVLNRSQLAWAEVAALGKKWKTLVYRRAMLRSFQCVHGAPWMPCHIISESEMPYCLPRTIQDGKLIRLGKYTSSWIRCPPRRGNRQQILWWFSALAGTAANCSSEFNFRLRLADFWTLKTAFQISCIYS